MAVATTERLRWYSAHRHFLAHLATMPRWHKIVLVLGVLLAVAGGVGRLMAHPGNASRARVTSAGSPAPTPAGTSKFIDDRAPAGSPATHQEQAPELISRLSPDATRIGGSVVAGFLLGWLFRAFLKTMAFFALLGAAILAGLSYFGVLNVDFSAAREHYATALHWLGDQTARLKDVVIGHLPSSGGGALGAFLGFRRR